MISKNTFLLFASSAIALACQAQVAPSVAGSALAPSSKPEPVLNAFAPRYPLKAASEAVAVAPVPAKPAPSKAGAMVVIDKLAAVNPTKAANKSVKSDANESAAQGSVVRPSPAILNLPIVDSSQVARPPKVQPQTQEMPGLGVMPGSPADYQIKSVRVGSDRNERIYISLQQLNKIATPFENPQAVDATGATLKAIGQDIFIKAASTEPFTIYISDGGVGQSIGLTLVSQSNLPAQSIVLVPDRPVFAGASASVAAPEMVAPDYTGRLIGLAKKLAYGTLPQGFTKSRLPRSLANDGKTIFEPLYKYVGGVFDVYSYSVKSILPEPVELNEESFYSDSVRAVAFYPHTMLQQDESTTVYIVVDRDVAGATK